MIKQVYDKKTGRIHNLLLRSREEQMTDDFFYGETKMIEIEKNYKITLNEEQALRLYDILDLTDNDKRQRLNVLYNELKDTLKIGIR